MLCEEDSGVEGEVGGGFFLARTRFLSGRGGVAEGDADVVGAGT